MQCYCCDRAMTSARKVKIRPIRHYEPTEADFAGPTPTPAYQSYVEDMTFRWAVICQACYSAMDNEIGAIAVVRTPGLPGEEWNLAGASRGDKAATIDEAKYLAFRRKEAAKLGIDATDE